MKKLLYFVLLLWCIGLAYWQWHPGGPRNRHLWMSELEGPPTAEEIATYQKCSAASQAAAATSDIVTWLGTACIDPEAAHRFNVIRVNVADSNAAHKGCWTVDFCVRHSETRVRPCK
jgi:hypothetical protein